MTQSSSVLAFVEIYACSEVIVLSQDLLLVFNKFNLLLNCIIDKMNLMQSLLNHELC